MTVAEIDFIGVSKGFQKKFDKRLAQSRPRQSLSRVRFPESAGDGRIPVARQVTTLCVVEMGGRKTMELLAGELGKRIFDGIVAILKPAASKYPQLQEEVFRHARNPASIRVVIPTNTRDLNPEIVIKHLKNLAEEAEEKSHSLTPEYLEASKVIRDPANGRLDAKKIAAYFALSQSELARIVGIGKATLHKTPSGKKSQAALEPFERIARLRILLNEDDQQVRNWLNTPNPDLAKVDGKHPAPMDIIRAGHPEIIAGMIERAFTGEPS